MKKLQYFFLTLCLENWNGPQDSRVLFIFTKFHLYFLNSMGAIYFWKQRTVFVFIKHRFQILHYWSRKVLTVMRKYLQLILWGQEDLAILSHSLEMIHLLSLLIKRSVMKTMTKTNPQKYKMRKSSLIVLAEISIIQNLKINMERGIILFTNHFLIYRHSICRSCTIFQGFHLRGIDIDCHMWRYPH